MLNLEFQVQGFLFCFVFWFTARQYLSSQNCVRKKKKGFLNPKASFLCKGLNLEFKA